MTSSAEPVQAPTIGRVVRYTLTETDAHRINKHPPPPRVPVEAGLECPAIVGGLRRRADLLLVNLYVFHPEAGAGWVYECQEGAGPGRWCWLDWDRDVPV